MINEDARRSGLCGEINPINGYVCSLPDGHLPPDEHESGRPWPPGVGECPTSRWIYAQ